MILADEQVPGGVQRCSRRAHTITGPLWRGSDISFRGIFAFACSACARVVLCLFLTGSEQTQREPIQPLAVSCGHASLPTRPCSPPLVVNVRFSLPLSSVLSACFCTSLFVGRSLALLPVVDCSRRPLRFTTRPACCCRCWLLHVVSCSSLVLLCLRRSLCAAPHTSATRSPARCYHPIARNPQYTLRPECKKTGAHSDPQHAHRVHNQEAVNAHSLSKEAVKTFTDPQRLPDQFHLTSCPLTPRRQERTRPCTDAVLNTCRTRVAVSTFDGCCDRSEGEGAARPIVCCGERECNTRRESLRSVYSRTRRMATPQSSGARREGVRCAVVLSHSPVLTQQSSLTPVLTQQQRESAQHRPTRRTFHCK